MPDITIRRPLISRRLLDLLQLELGEIQSAVAEVTTADGRRVRVVLAGDEAPPRPVESPLDGLTSEAVRLTRTLFPRADWAAWTVHQPGVPDVMLPITL